MSATPQQVGGRYEVIREIAAGGMGTVYEARHLLSRRRVALKVLHPHVTYNDAAKERFLREVRAPAHIEHPGIVDVFDAGVDGENGSLFIAMELLEGEDLRQRLTRGGLDRAKALDFFERLLEPLAAAHDKGVVHRDLKPENVFLAHTHDGSEQVKLLDFGIVRDVGATSSVTEVGTAMGTPEYMSPEQATSARDVDARADVWAVGIMLYEILGGSTPFGSTSPSATVARMLTEPHLPLSSLCPTTPKAVEVLIDRCLSKDPDSRPRDAGAVLAALRAVRTREAIPATTAMAATGPAVTPPPAEREATASPPAAHSRGAAQQPSESYLQAGPAASPVRSKGAFGVTIVALIAVTVCVLLAVGGGLLLWRAGAFTMPTSELPPTGQVVLRTSLAGTQLHVDGQPRGHAASGQPVVLSAGAHRLDLYAGGIRVATSEVQVIEGQSVDASLELPVRTVEGTLGPGDRQLSGGEWADYHAQEWPAGLNVRIDLRSTSFDAYLAVQTPSGRTLENDDAVAGQTDATLELVTEQGIHQVVTTSYEAAETGRYELILRAP